MLSRVFSTVEKDETDVGVEERERSQTREVSGILIEGVSLVSLKRFHV